MIESRSIKDLQHSSHLIFNSCSVRKIHKFVKKFVLAVGNLIKSESKGKRRGQSQRLTKVKRV